MKTKRTGAASLHFALSLLLTGMVVAGCSNPLGSGKKTSTVARGYNPGIPNGTADARYSTIISTSGSVIANGTAKANVTIVLLDKDLHPVPNEVPTFSATDTRGTNEYSACSETSVLGISNCTFTSEVAETKTLKLSSPSVVTGGTVTFIHGPAASIRFSTNPVGAAAGSPLSAQPVVSIFDPFQNSVTDGPDSSANISLSLTSGTGAITGTASAHAVAGVATFSGISVDTPGIKVFTATKASTTPSGVGVLTALSASFDINSTPPGAFTLTSATPGNAQVILSWAASSNAASYTVKYGTTSGSYGSTASTSATSPYTITGLSNSQTYYFKVTAVNGFGSQDSSNELSAHPIAPPSIPASLTGQGTHNNSALAWTASTGTGTITYSVYRSSTSGSGYTQLTNNISTNYYNDATASDGSTYYYVVTASSSGSESAYSSEIDVEPINSFLLSTAVAGNQQIVLTWTSPTGSSTFDVNYGTTTDTYSTTLSNQTSPKTVSSLTAGTTYYLSVTAKNAHNGLVVATNELSATPLGAFTITSAAQSGGGQVAIAWAASTGATSYDVKYGTVSGTYGTPFSNTTSTSATVTGLSNTQTYYFMVTAKNASGSVNAGSEASVTLIDVPSVPASLAVTASNGGANLSWGASTGSGTIKYNVLRSTTSGSSYTSVSANQSGTSFTDSGLTNGTTYYYVVQSSNIGGNSANSSEISARPIASFSISSVTPDIGQATVAWSGPTGASTYTVYYSTTSGQAVASGTATCSATTSSSCTITGLTGGTTYYFAVKAANTSNGTYTTTESSSVPMQTVNYTWTFDTGTDSSYTFDSTKVELATNGSSAQVGRLKNLTPGDSSNSSSYGFGAGTLSGLKWDSTNLKLTIDSTTASGELSALWTPQYDKIIGYWKLNGTASSNIAQGTVIPATIGADGVFQNANASAFPTTGYTSSQLNQGIQFDGTDDGINLGAIANFTSESFTISQWVNLSSVTSGSGSGPVLVYKGSYLGSGYYAQILNTTGALCFMTNQSGAYQMSCTAGNALVTNQWHHLTYVRAGPSVRIYINGVDQTSTAATHLNPLSSTAGFQLGQYPSPLISIRGIMDEVAIWNSALAPSEVRTLYERQHAPYSGTFLSRVFDSGTSSSWQGLNWTTTLPYGKGLPSSQSIEAPNYTGLGLASSQNLLGLWHLDEASGTTGAGSVIDSSGQGNHGTPSGGFTLGGSGKIGTDILLNGTSGSVDVPALTQTSYSTDFSICSWINPTAYPSLLSSVVGWGNAGVGPYYSFRFGLDSSGVSTFTYYNGANTTATAGTIPLNQWSHLCVSASKNGTATVYLNGVAGTPISVGTMIVNRVDSWDKTMIGIRPEGGPSYFTGSIDEVAIWSRSLSASEISALYQSTSPIQNSLMAGNIVLWHLDETSASSGGAGKDFRDDSGNGNWGKLNGTVTLGMSGKIGNGIKLDGTTGYASATVATLPTGTQARTLSTWFYSTVSASTYSNNISVILSHGDDSTGQLFALAHIYSAGNEVFGLWGSSNNLFGVAFTLNQWHLGTVTYDGTTTKIYVDGVLGATGTPALNTSSANKLLLQAGKGGSGYASQFPGLLDEVAVWNRALNASEIKQYYQRGANRVKFQIRTCSQSDCSDDSTNTAWKGPNGSSSTYFSEDYNFSSQSASPSGSILTTEPSMSFGNFTSLGSQTSQYLQYRAILESDSASVFPDITTVSTGPAKYDGSTPIIVPVNGPAYQTLTGFSVTLGASCSTVSNPPKFQISRDKTTWYYYSSGWSTTTGGYASASNATTINSNISSFATGVGTGTLYVKAFLPSDTTTPCEIDSITLNAGHASPSTSSNPNSFQLTSISGGSSQVTLNWGAATYATSYTVCYGTTQALADACGTTYSAGSSTSGTITGLTNGTQYYFTVVATDASGSTASSPTSTTVNSVTPLAIPSTPGTLAATSGISHVQLSWTASTGIGAITYNIKRSTSSGSGYTTLAAGVTGTAYTDLTALNGTTYYYVVSASNINAASSANSNEVSAVAIGSFTLSSVVGTNGTAIVNWSAATGATATKYTVQWGSSGAYTNSATNQSQASGYTITGLANNTAYAVMVTANNSTGSANASAEKSVTPVAIPSPSVSAAANSFTISWSATTGAASYNVQYGTSTGSYSTTLTSQTNPVTVSSLIAGTTYYVRLQALNTNNGLSNSSELTVVPTHPFTFNWDFNTSSSYTYGTTIDFNKAGVCELTQLDTDADGTSAGFGGGTFAGTSYTTVSDGISSGSALQLANNGGCNGTTANCANANAPELYELNSTWTPAWSSIVGYWKMNNNWTDSVGGHHGTAEGNATFTSSSKVGSYAGSFSGYATGDDVDVTGTYLDGATSFTVAAWVNVSNFTNWNGVFGADAGNSLFHFQITPSSPPNISIYAYASSGGQAVGATNLTSYLNKWIHVAGTYDGTNVKVYLNGVLDGTGTASGPLAGVGANHIKIGRTYITSGNRNLTGKMDEVAVWKNTALTAAQISTIYVRQTVAYSGVFTSRVMDATASQSWTSFSWVPTLPFFKELTATSESNSNYSSLSDNTLMSGLIGLWHLNEAAGTSGAGSVIDSSSTGSNGTPTSVTFGSPGKLNTSATFDGSNSYISVPDNTAYSNLSAITLTAWIYPTAYPASGHSATIITKNTEGIGGTIADPFEVWTFVYNQTGNVVAVISTGAPGSRGILTSAATLPLNTWSQVTFTYNGSTMKLYFNGVQDANTTSASMTIGTSNNTYAPLIGAFLCSSYPEKFTGMIDEVAIWNRALTDGTSSTPKEVQQLYQRGASRLKFQVKTCSASDCSDTTTWKGPDGSANTYFSELNNMSTQGATPSGTVNTTPPSMTLQTYPTPVPTNRYFQYRTIFESDSSTISLMPELKSVSAGPNHYDSASPTVITVGGTSYLSLSGFTETLGGACAGAPKYQLSIDKSTWYYWTGTAWATANNTTAQANIASDINTNISTFKGVAGTGTLYARVFMVSDGTHVCEIDNLQVTGGN